jgi:hypothetical protein
MPRRPAVSAREDGVYRLRTFLATNSGTVQVLQSRPRKETVSPWFDRATLGTGVHPPIRTGARLTGAVPVGAGSALAVGPAQAIGKPNASKASGDARNRLLQVFKIPPGTDLLPAYTTLMRQSARQGFLGCNCMKLQVKPSDWTGPAGYETTRRKVKLTCLRWKRRARCMAVGAPRRDLASQAHRSEPGASRRVDAHQVLWCNLASLVS